MPNSIIKTKKKIEERIYEIRGVQVMLDSDLAELYNVETKRINEAVKNNPQKFPERFAFRITEHEYYNLKSKFSTSRSTDHGGSRKGHTAFTEQGVAMLATILKSQTAIEATINIMDTFVAMRKYISNSILEQKYINNLVLKHEDNIKLLQESFEKFEEKKTKEDIYFDGQIFDAYSKIYEIFKLAGKKLIIIDNYADNMLLDIIKRLDIKVTIITKKDNLLTYQDINKYNKQYSNLEVIFNNTFHDRYFIIDDVKVYHCGSSINRIGYKTFSINFISDKEINELLISRVKSIIK